MPFVVDASVAASWFLPDEDVPLANRAFDLLGEDTAVAPGLFWYELRNILVVNERRGRIDSDQTGQVLAMLEGLPITLDHAADERTVLALARRFNLTVYDAAYLELALRLKAPLATLDAAMVRAAPTAGVTLFAPG